MCGIAGILQATSGRNPSDLRDRVEPMASAMRHRGPDDAGTWTDKSGAVALAHRRLSIVDLSPLGRNPMLRDGGRLAITFNGEIYNFRELRQELEAMGHRFASRTDTEVILAAYDEWGFDCLERFVGMFAFGLWDAARQRLWLVRDRVGKKPLYYASEGGRLTFASELKALTADPAFSRRIDRTALGLYLRWGYVPAPLSIYQQVRKLPPAHYLVAEAGQTSVHRYWDPLHCLTPASEGAGSMDEQAAEARLDELLGLAVAQRRIADVPLGAFLSGGIDSSLIVALMAEQSDSPVSTHTIRFANPEYNEADHAAAVARHLGTEHHEMLCDETQLLDVVPRLPGMFDEPFADSSAIPTFLVSQATRRDATVALSGDGGDELFFGYPRYLYYADSGWALNLPRPLRKGAAAIARRAPTRRLRRIADVLDDDGDDYARMVALMGVETTRALTGAAVAAPPAYADALARIGTRPREERPPILDFFSYLPDDILVKVDRASMAVSLEVRSPFLDHRVVEFALGLPHSLKRRGGSTKWLLRRLLEKRVPRALIDRPKMGFGVPLRDWFAGPLRTPMDAYCAGPAYEAVGLDPAPLRRMWDEYKAGARHRPDLIWQAFSLAAWADHAFRLSE